MKVNFFITFILCLHDLIPFNGAFDYHDVQPGISEDVVDEEKLGIYKNDDIYANDFRNDKNLPQLLVNYINESEIFNHLRICLI